jgi:hypothetical protein
MKLIISYPAEALLETVQLPGNTNSCNLAFWLRDTCDRQRYLTLVDQYGIPDIIVSSAHPEYSEVDVKTQYFYCPTFLYSQVCELADQAKIATDYTVEYCFNFMINKKQINRYLLLKLVEWFNLSSYCYTWSGIGKQFDMSQIFKDFKRLHAQGFDQDKFYSHMLSPVTQILPHFINYNSKKNINESDSVNIKNYGGNTWAWNNIFVDMFSKSAISLITENAKYEKPINFTEKTLYSVFGLTFPIWIGGYRQAELWKQHGFDTFDDIINHNYQYYDSILERCFYAILYNFKILNDLNYAKIQKQQCLSRLQLNRELAKNKIQCAVLDGLANMPPDLSTYILQNSESTLVDIYNK